MSLNAIDLAGLNARYAPLSTADMLEDVLHDPAFGKIIAVSSFGTESGVLLHLLASVDAGIPVVMVDTGKLFGETLRYRDQLKKQLALTNVRIALPETADLSMQDPKGILWNQDIDACCDIRKVRPLDRALTDVDTWISGRKSFQSASRSVLPLFEIDGRRLKINPLAGWDKTRLDDYFVMHNLPRHPLEAEGYLSIGCMPCTRPVAVGEDARSGRWAGLDKTECGIHRPTEAPDFNVVF
jgi:phosphoadenosine phosphosulfate reductase